MVGVRPHLDLDRARDELRRRFLVLDQRQRQRPEDGERDALAADHALDHGIAVIPPVEDAQQKAAELKLRSNTSSAERSLVRRAAVLTTELERLEMHFALAGEADPETLDLYARTAGNLRRLLEAVGLSRRSKNVTPTLREYIEQAASEEGEP